MIRGTQILEGVDAIDYTATIDRLTRFALGYGYEQIIFPSLWEPETFINKAGMDILTKMYTFKDKGQRDCCLIPEVTALIQDLYNEKWAKSKPKPIKVFYVQNCFRYDRPQAGRYRQFTQFGVEILGKVPNLKDPTTDKEDVIKLAKALLPEHSGFVFKDSVKRGLNYYVEDGFEIEYPGLGAQKQILGGGRYKEGIGFAIGVERLMMCKKSLDNSSEGE